MIRGREDNRGGPRGPVFEAYALAFEAYAFLADVAVQMRTNIFTNR
jgi:hypothetical protein